MGRHARKPLKPDEEDVFCSACGARNPQGAQRCSACGARL